MATTYKTTSERSTLVDAPALRVAITGGTSGLGLALVKEFCARGAQVAFIARNAERVAQVAGEMAGTHGIVGDVADNRSIYPIALQIVADLGGLDVLINNASSLGPAVLKPLADTASEELELAIATNLFGPFRLIKALLGSLAASARQGRRALAVNISSDAAVNAYPSWGAYGSSKAALLHLSRIWNEELRKEGVSVLSFDPGDMDTPLHRVANPGAEPATLKRPEASARELADLIGAAPRTGRFEPTEVSAQAGAGWL